MQHLIGSGLVAWQEIVRPYEGLQALSVPPPGFRHVRLPAVRYPVNLAFQFIAALQDPDRRSQVSLCWRSCLDHCLALLRASRDAMEHPGLLTVAESAAKGIVEAFDGGSPRAPVQTAGTWSAVVGPGPSATPGGLVQEHHQVIRGRDCWPGTSPSGLQELVALAGSPLFQSPGQVREPFALDYRVRAEGLPEHFPEPPARCSYALAAMLQVLVAMEETIDRDSVAALLEKEPNCSPLLDCCLGLLPHLTELDANGREAMRGVVAGLKKLIRHHVVTEGAPLTFV